MLHAAQNGNFREQVIWLSNALARQCGSIAISLFHRE